jgi:hypothetical protein
MLAQLQADIARGRINAKPAKTGTEATSDPKWEPRGREYEGLA